jgi:uncharacterized membrane protein YkvA (DUF1232 family)
MVLQGQYDREDGVQRWNERGSRMLGLLARLAFNIRTFGVQIYALLLAAKDPRTPWHVRIMGLLVVAYLVSPIDIVPVVVPFFGLVDDLIIVPLGLKAVSSMIPAQVQSEAQARAARSVVAHPRFWRWVKAIFAIILLIWIAVIVLLVYVLFRWIT